MKNNNNFSTWTLVRQCTTCWESEKNTSIPAGIVNS